MQKTKIIALFIWHGLLKPVGIFISICAVFVGVVLGLNWLNELLNQYFIKNLAPYIVFGLFIVCVLSILFFSAYCHLPDLCRELNHREQKKEQ